MGCKMAWSKEKQAEYLKKWIANNRDKWNGYQRKYYAKARCNTVSNLQELNIGEAIRKAREAKGYTIPDLVRKAGVAFQTLHNWEKGISYPNVVYLIPVADALGVTLDELVGRTVAK